MASKERTFGLRKRGDDSQSHSMNEKEVCASEAPENVLSSSILANNAPEIYSSNAPETLHEPLDLPPEMAVGLGLETNFEGIELDVLSEHGVPVEPKRRFSKRTKIWTGIFVASIIIAAIISGAIGGIVASRNSRCVGYGAIVPPRGFLTYAP